jgi:hypothetical protein
VSHGIDISEAAVAHSIRCSAVWREKSARKISPDQMSFLRGNCFDIDVLDTMRCCKYDRIYVGAGCPESRKEFFFSMLSDQGLLVLPVNEQNKLVRVKRYMGQIFSVAAIASVHFAPLVQAQERDHQMDHLTVVDEEVRLLRERSDSDPAHSILKIPASEAQSITIFNSSSASKNKPLSRRTTFLSSLSSSLTSSPSSLHVKLPSVLWAPIKTRHWQFPREFREAVMTILMASNRTKSTSASQLFSAKCDASFVPFQIWIYILTFANRFYFNLCYLSFFFFEIIYILENGFHHPSLRSSFCILNYLSRDS